MLALAAAARNSGSFDQAIATPDNMGAFSSGEFTAVDDNLHPHGSERFEVHLWCNSLDFLSYSLATTASTGMVLVGDHHIPGCLVWCCIPRCVACHKDQYVSSDWFCSYIVCLG